MAFTKKTKKTIEPIAEEPVVKRGRGRPAGQHTTKKQKVRYSDGFANQFSIYIHKVMKQVHPECRISRNAMSIMNSMMKDLFERISAEASKLAMRSKRPTLISRDIQTAVRLIFPGELAKHAVSEGTKAVAKYHASKE